MSSLLKLSQQIQDGILPLSPLEALSIQMFREFPKAERMKIIDLLSRFSIARRYSGEIRFDFHWLIEVEGNHGYDAMVDQEKDVLKGIRFE